MPIVETKEWRDVDKSSWPRGPWDDEPDKRQWEDPDTGLPCLAVRQCVSGHWCGYVGVREGHPAFAKGHENLIADVHGGLTFSAFGHEGGRIFHETNAPDRVWWLGFDCARHGDASPAGRRSWSPDDRYRSLAYVERECKSLAAQLSAVTE